MTQLKRLSSLNSIRSIEFDDTVELTLSVNAALHDLPERPVEIWRSLVGREAALKSRIVGLNAAAKRLFDLSVACLALIVLSPLLLLVALAIKLESTGPALFCQHRRGRNGENIKVYKFRSMYQDHSCTVPTAKTFIQAKKDDPRVTRFGAFLRRTSIDELPQLLNVLEGSMSLVGPRPHPIPLDEKYKHVIPRLNSRYAVKSGITGWAQVNGFRGETLRVEDMVARIEHDLHYIRNWTLFLDFKILALTVVKGWTHRNAY